MALTGNTPTITEIQNFDTSNATHFAAGFNAGMAVDWVNGFFYLNKVDAGLRKLRMSDFTEPLNAAVAQVDGPMVCDQDGNVWCFRIGGLHRYNPATLAQVSVTAFGGLFADMVCLKVGGVNLMVASASFVTDHIRVFNLDTPLEAASFAPDEAGTPMICRSGAHLDTVYVVVPGRNSGFADARPAGVYKIVVAADATHVATKLGTILPSQVDPAWTHWSSWRGILADEQNDDIIAVHEALGAALWNVGNSYDQYDVITDGVRDYESLSTGNLGNTPSTSPGFWRDLGAKFSTDIAKMFKVKPADRSIPWAVEVGAPGYQNSRSQIKYSRLCYIDVGSETDGKRYFHSINTGTGSDTKQEIFNVLVSDQMYDDFTGDMYFSCQYTDVPLGTTTPHPHGTTPAAWGNNWATLGGFPQPAALPPSAFTTKQGSIFG